MHKTLTSYSGQERILCLKYSLWIWWFFHPSKVISSHVTEATQIPDRQNLDLFTTGFHRQTQTVIYALTVAGICQSMFVHNRLIFTIYFPGDGVENYWGFPWNEVLTGNVKRSTDKQPGWSASDNLCNCKSVQNLRPLTQFAAAVAR